MNPPAKPAEKPEPPATMHWRCAYGRMVLRHYEACPACGGPKPAVKQ